MAMSVEKNCQHGELAPKKEDEVLWIGPLTREFVGARSGGSISESSREESDVGSLVRRNYGT